MTSTGNSDEMAPTPGASHAPTDSVSFTSLAGPVSSDQDVANLDRGPGTALVAAEDRATSPTPAMPVSTSLPEPALGQLEGILANLTTYATPVLREIAARAAELAAKAGEAAGPAARKAAGVTDQLGTRMAAKGREVASDLRRGPGADEVAAAEASSTDPGA